MPPNLREFYPPITRLDLRYFVQCQEVIRQDVGFVFNGYQDYLVNGFGYISEFHKFVQYPVVLYDP